MRVRACLILLFFLVGGLPRQGFSADQPQTLLSLDLTGCPEGAALEWPDIPKDRQVCGPPNPEVDGFFKGWTAALSGWMGTPSCLKVVRENGESVLSNQPYGQRGIQARVLVGGKMGWEDYAVEATVRLINQGPSSAYGEHTSLPFVGVFARYQDLNRFYLLALRPGGVTLFRRRNSEWTTLARSDFPVAPDRFYSLRLQADGKRLTGSVDGKNLVTAEDAEYECGKTGVRFNADVRVKSIRVSMDQAGIERAARREARQAEQVAEARRRYAGPVVHKTLDIPKLAPVLGGFNCYPARLVSADKRDLVLTSGVGKTVAMDLDGKVLWEAPVFLDKVALGAPDANGVSRIVGLSGQRLVMLDGRTGKQIAECPVPGPRFLYGPWRLGNLTGKGEVNYAVRLGDNTPDIIVYDENLKELFRRKVSIEIGHTFGLGFWDVDGDGREELLAGGSLLRGDGKSVWDCRVTETHLDQVVLGPLGPQGEPTAIFLGVDEGVFFLDGFTGDKLACVDVGHSQGIAVGNFRPDIPGLEPLVFDRWGAFGVTSLFTGRGAPLKQWMLVPEEYYALQLPVSWRGDGGELIMVSRKFDRPTLYDGEGREIFQLPVEPGYYFPYTHLFPLDVTGDSREEILVTEKSGRITIFTQDAPPPKDMSLAPPPVKWMLMSLPPSAFGGPPPNLLTNGGFEDADAGGAPVGWTKQGAPSLATAADLVWEGRGAARTRFDDGFWQDFAVKPNTRYVVSGFVRHEKPGVEPARLKILFKDDGDTLVGSEACRIFGLSSAAYKPFRFEMTTPDFASKCSFGILGRFTGSEWMLYDNVSFREVRR